MLFNGQMPNTPVLAMRIEFSGVPVFGSVACWACPVLFVDKLCFVLRTSAVRNCGSGQ